MAEVIGIASGLLTLSGFAFNSGVSLLKTVQSFQNHPRAVKELIEELEALNSVLNPLAELAKATDDEALSELDLPLFRCGQSCEGFEQEVLRCSSRSNSDRTSFRDWAKLRYMGDNIDGFKRQLSTYKLTINIALTHATLRKSSVTAENLQRYKQLVNEATDELKFHLESVDDKLERLLEQSAANSDASTTEQQLMRQEQLSAKRCLQICLQLSEHIDQIQLELQSSSVSSGMADSENFLDASDNAGLQECKENLMETATKLEAIMNNIMDRLVDKSRNGMNAEEAEDLSRLRDEWQMTRRGVSLCNQAQQHLNHTVSKIKNHAVGDAVQFMVSTGEKTIHGENKGEGWRSRQVGGHMGEESLQQMIQGMLGVQIQVNKRNGDPAQEKQSTSPDAAADEDGSSSFRDKFGQGRQLTPKPDPAENRVSARPAPSK